MNTAVSFTAIFLTFWCKAGTVPPSLPRPFPAHSCQQHVPPLLGSHSAAVLTASLYTTTLCLVRFLNNLKTWLHLIFVYLCHVTDCLPCRLFTELEAHWKQSVILTAICEIIYNYAHREFDVYIKYCSNQAFQDRTLKKLIRYKPIFSIYDNIAWCCGVGVITSQLCLYINQNLLCLR